MSAEIRCSEVRDILDCTKCIDLRRSYFVSYLMHLQTCRFCRQHRNLVNRHYLSMPVPVMLALNKPANQPRDLRALLNKPELSIPREELLLQPVESRRAIIFEDDKFIGKEIFHLLRSWGFEVLWLIKILEIREGGVRGLCRDPLSDPIKEEAVYVEWANNKFDVALVDGQLGPTGMNKDGPHGWDLLPSLTPHFLRKADLLHCVLISASEIDNGIMKRENGVQFATHHKRSKPDAFGSDLTSFFSQLGLLQEP